MIDQLSQFLDSAAYQSLVEEAEHNHHALQLMENIHLNVDSALFFARLNETDRMNRELQCIEKIIKLLTKLYEE